MKDFKCMLAKPLVEKRVQYPCFVSPKLDGIRAVLYEGKLYTRNKNRVKGVSHIEEALAGTKSLDGELMVPGLPFQKSSGLIRSFNDTPDAVYYAFDIPELEIPQNLRIKWMNLMEFESPHIEIVPHVIANDITEIENAYDLYRYEGYEGVMVKSFHGLYTNTRSAAWQKIKAKITHDCPCIGFFEGQGRLMGSLGGIIVDFNQVPVRVGGGFTDGERDEIWANPEKYLGMISEVEAQEVTPDGSMRHPRHITWRTDL